MLLDRLFYQLEFDGGKLKQGVAEATTQFNRLRGGASQVSGALQGITGAIPFASLLGAAGAVAAVTTALGEMQKAAQAAAQFESAQVTFENFASSVGANGQKLLTQLRQTTVGMIADTELMQKSTLAMSLISKEAMGDISKSIPALAKLAVTAARTTGESVSFMFDSIVRGIGRGSPLILDNLGITVKMEEVYGSFARQLGINAEQLSSAQKQQALLNAVMLEGEKMAARLGESGNLAQFAFQRLETSAANLRVTIGQRVLPVMQSLTQSFLNPALSGLNRLFQTAEQRMQDASTAFAQGTNALQAQEQEATRLIEEYQRLTRELKMVREDSKEARDKKEALRQVIVQLVQLVPQAATAFDEEGRAIALNTEKIKESLKYRGEMLKAAFSKQLAEGAKEFREVTQRIEDYRMALELLASPELQRALLIQYTMPSKVGGREQAALMTIVGMTDKARELVFRNLDTAEKSSVGIAEALGKSIQGVQILLSGELGNVTDIVSGFGTVLETLPDFLKRAFNELPASGEGLADFVTILHGYVTGTDDDLTRLVRSAKQMGVVLGQIIPSPMAGAEAVGTTLTKEALKAREKLAELDTKRIPILDAANAVVLKYGQITETIRRDIQQEIDALRERVRLGKGAMDDIERILDMESFLEQAREDSLHRQRELWQEAFDAQEDAQQRAEKEREADMDYLREKTEFTMAARVKEAQERQKAMQEASVAQKQLAQWALEAEKQALRRLDFELQIAESQGSQALVLRRQTIELTEQALRRAEITGHLDEQMRLMSRLAELQQRQREEGGLLGDSFQRGTTFFERVDPELEAALDYDIGDVMVQIEGISNYLRQGMIRRSIGEIASDWLHLGTAGKDLREGLKGVGLTGVKAFGDIARESSATAGIIADFAIGFMQGGPIVGAFNAAAGWISGAFSRMTSASRKALEEQKRHVEELRAVYKSVADDLARMLTDALQESGHIDPVAFAKSVFQKQFWEGVKGTIEQDPAFQNLAGFLAQIQTGTGARGLGGVSIERAALENERSRLRARMRGIELSNALDEEQKLARMRPLQEQMEAIERGLEEAPKTLGDNLQIALKQGEFAAQRVGENLQGVLSQFGDLGGATEAERSRAENIFTSIRETTFEQAQASLILETAVANHTAQIAQNTSFANQLLTQIRDGLRGVGGALAAPERVIIPEMPQPQLA